MPIPFHRFHSVLRLECNYSATVRVPTLNLVCIRIVDKIASIVDPWFRCEDIGRYLIAGIRIKWKMGVPLNPLAVYCVENYYAR